MRLAEHQRDIGSMPRRLDRPIQFTSAEPRPTRASGSGDSNANPGEPLGCCGRSSPTSSIELAQTNLAR